MRIVNEKLLDLFRWAGKCGWCGKRSSATKLDPHHVFSRGAGRVDIRLNLVPLCLPFVGNNCHGLVHTGHIARFDLLAVVAAREDVIQDEIEDVIQTIRRLPKGTPWDGLPAMCKPFVERYADE